MTYMLTRIGKQVVIDFSLSAMEIWRRLPEGVRAEVINEKLYFLAPPTTYHADIAGIVFHELMLHLREFKNGHVYAGNVGVVLKNKKNGVIPDVVFVSHENEQATILESGIVGPPDLLFEVLSPSNKRHDLVTKKNLYEEAGVKEYWIIDSIKKNSQGYLMKDGKYGDPLRMKSEVFIRILNKTIRF